MIDYPECCLGCEFFDECEDIEDLCCGCKYEDDCPLQSMFCTCKRGEYLQCNNGYEEPCLFEDEEDNEEGEEEAEE